MMRDEGQMSSDFQEYTLIALFSLAAHLAGGVAAERASLPAMARYYNQDEDTLSQVLHVLCPCSCPTRKAKPADRYRSLTGAQSSCAASLRASCPDLQGRLLVPSLAPLVMSPGAQNGGVRHGP